MHDMVFKHIKSFLLQHIGQSLLLVFAVILSNSLRLLIPLSVGYFYEINLHSDGAKMQFLHQLPFDIHSNQDYFLFEITIIIVFGIFYFIQDYLSKSLAENYTSSLRLQLFTHQMNQSTQQFEEQKLEKITLKYSGEMKAIYNYISKGIFVFVGDCVFALLVFATLFNFNKVLSLVLVVFYILVLIVNNLISKKSATLFTSHTDTRSLFLQFINKTFSLFYSIKSFNKERHFINTFSKKNSALLQSAYKKNAIDSFQEVLIRMAVFIGIIVIMAVIVLSPAQTFAKHTILVCVLLLLYFQSTMRRILKVQAIWKKGKITLFKNLTTLKIPVEVRPEETIPKGKCNGVIEIRNLIVANSQESNLVFNTGIHLIQAKDSSETDTLFKILQKERHPSQGELLLDHINYNDLTSFEIKRNITIISNNTPLMGKSILEMVTYNNDQEKQFKIIQYLETLNYNPMPTLDDLSKKINKESGIVFTMEQSKLLQYVRALGSNKKIWLIQNPFEYISEANHACIINLINSIRNKKTIIISDTNNHKELNLDQIITI